jgi:hypothetical protein
MYSNLNAKYFMGIVMREDCDMKSRKACLPQAGASTVAFNPLESPTFIGHLPPN